MRIPVCIALSLAAVPVAAQGITIAEGELQDLTVRVFQENDLSAPATVVLDNAEFLGIEVTGRTVLQDLDTSRPRRALEDGLWRVEMPGAERLMRYRREGGLHHGFLWIPASGIASVVLELAGVGPSGLDDPFADRVGVSPDGRHVAVPLLGSGLEVICLEDGSSSMVPTSAPVVPGSLMVGTHVFFVTADERLWRLPLNDESLPEDVTPPGVMGSEFEDELALSGDGSTIVFLYGPDMQQSFWVLRGSGPASPLSPPPGKYEDPGYLPEGEGHPRLLLNEDGSSLLYSDHTVDDEIFLLDLSAPAPHHLTADANFEPYIGVMILPFFRGGTLLAAIGDPEQLDWFIADATPGHVVNLTLTGPVPRPFYPGTLDPRNAVLTPSSLLVTERAPSGATCLRSMTLGAPEGVILYDNLMGDLVPGSRYAGGFDFLVMTSGGDRLVNGAGQELVSAPPGVSLSRPARGPGGLLTLFRASANGHGAAFLHLADGTIVGTPPETGLKQAVFTARNGVLLNGDTLRYISPGNFTVIPTSGAAVTLVLSGAGS